MASRKQSFFDRACVTVFSGAFPTGLLDFVGGAKIASEGINEGDGVVTGTGEGFSTGLIGSIFPENGNTTAGTTSACLVSSAAVAAAGPDRMRDWCCTALARSRFWRDGHFFRLCPPFT